MAKRGRPPKTAQEQSKTSKLRQLTFDLDDLEQFEKMIETKGLNTSAFFRTVMRDFLRKEYISLSQMTPEIREEVKRYAVEIFNDEARIQSAFDAIIGQWVRTRRQK